jgi:hypothetical protein
MVLWAHARLPVRLRNDCHAKHARPHRSDWFGWLIKTWGRLRAGPRRAGRAAGWVGAWHAIPVIALLVWWWLLVRDCGPPGDSFAGLALGYDSILVGCSLLLGIAIATVVAVITPRRPRLYANLASAGGMTATTYVAGVLTFIGYHALAGSPVGVC